VSKCGKKSCLLRYGNNYFKKCFMVQADNLSIDDKVSGSMKFKTLRIAFILAIFCETFTLGV